MARKAVVWFFQGMLCGFIHVDFTLQNRPLPFTEKCEKGSGLVVLSENQDFNFFGKKLAITKEKALNPLRFKAFGAARQIRTADLILTKKVGGPRPPTSPRFCVESKGIFSFPPDCGRFLWL